MVSQPPVEYILDFAFVNLLNNAEQAQRRQLLQQLSDGNHLLELTQVKPKKGRAKETCRSTNCPHKNGLMVDSLFFILRKSVVNGVRDLTSPRPPKVQLTTILESHKGPGGLRGVGRDGDEYWCLYCMDRNFADRGLAFLSQFMFAAPGDYKLDSVIENALECYKAVLLFDHHKDNSGRPRDAIDFRTPAHIQSSSLLLGRFGDAYYRDEQSRDMRGHCTNGVIAEVTVTEARRLSLKALLEAARNHSAAGKERDETRRYNRSRQGLTQYSPVIIESDDETPSNTNSKLQPQRKAKSKPSANVKNASSVKAEPLFISTSPPRRSTDAGNQLSQRSPEPSGAVIQKDGENDHHGAKIRNIADMDLYDASDDEQPLMSAYRSGKSVQNRNVADMDLYDASDDEQPLKSALRSGKSVNKSVRFEPDLIQSSPQILHSPNSTVARPGRIIDDWSVAPPPMLLERSRYASEQPSVKKERLSRISAAEALDTSRSPSDSAVLRPDLRRKRLFATSDTLSEELPLQHSAVVSEQPFSEEEQISDNSKPASPQLYSDDAATTLERAVVSEQTITAEEQISDISKPVSPQHYSSENDAAITFEDTAVPEQRIIEGLISDISKPASLQHSSSKNDAAITLEDTTVPEQPIIEKEQVSDISKSVSPQYSFSENDAAMTLLNLRSTIPEMAYDRSSAPVRDANSGREASHEAGVHHNTAIESVANTDKVALEQGMIATGEAVEGQSTPTVADPASNASVQPKKRKVGKTQTEPTRKSKRIKAAQTQGLDAMLDDMLGTAVNNLLVSELSKLPELEGAREDLQSRLEKRGREITMEMLKETVQDASLQAWIEFLDKKLADDVQVYDIEGKTGRTVRTNHVRGTA